MGGDVAIDMGAAESSPLMNEMNQMQIMDEQVHWSICTVALFNQIEDFLYHKNQKNISMQLFSFAVLWSVL